MLLHIRQTIKLSFDVPVTRCVQHVMLTPADTPTQTVTSWTIEGPGMAHAAGFVDAFGNEVHLCNQTEPLSELVFTVTGAVETSANNGVLGTLAGDPAPGMFLRITPDTRSPVTMHGPFRHVPLEGGARVEVLHGLMERVHATLIAAREQDGDIVPAADFAESFVAGARALGIPARFVRGYLAAPEAAAIGDHYWAEAWDDGLGWIGFDPVYNVCPLETYVRVAVGLDAASTVKIRCHPAASTQIVSLNDNEIEVAGQRQQ